MDELDRRNHGTEVGYSSSTKELLKDYAEKKENLEYSRARAQMDVLLGWLAASFELEEGYPIQLDPVKIGEPYIFASYNCLYQAGQSRLQANQARKLRFPISANWGVGHVIKDVSWKPPTRLSTTQKRIRRSWQVF